MHARSWLLLLRAYEKGLEVEASFLLSASLDHSRREIQLEMRNPPQIGFGRSFGPRRYTRTVHPASFYFLHLGNVMAL